MFCSRNEGEFATGGGFSTDDSRLIVRESHAYSNGNNMGWSVSALNNDTTRTLPGTSHYIQAAVECMKFVP